MVRYLNDDIFKKIHKLNIFKNLCEEIWNDTYGVHPFKISKEELSLFDKIWKRLANLKKVKQLK